MRPHGVKVRPPGINPLESFLEFQIGGLEAQIQLEKIDRQMRQQDGTYVCMTERQKFEEWMRKIGNVYRTDDRRMAIAYEKITDLKYR